MTNEPVICFGQQPAGFFPKRFLYAKIETARKLREKIGGKIVFFYHDSDADYRETITIMRDRQTGAEVRLNFTQENKLQKKFSPLYLKRIPTDWKEETLKQLPRFFTLSPTLPQRGRETAAPPVEEGLTSPPSPFLSDEALAKADGRGAGLALRSFSEGGGEGLIDIFKSVDQKLVADFCLEMYRKIGLLEGIEVLRSSDKNFREKASELAGDYFADVEYRGEIVRAKIQEQRNNAELNAEQRGMPVPQNSASDSATFREAVLHEGGDKFIRFPIDKLIQKSQKNPARDQRFAWMQSVINCTHYIYGEGEKEYLDVSPFPEIKFVDREKIDEPNYAWLG